MYNGTYFYYLSDLTEKGRLKVFGEKQKIFRMSILRDGNTGFRKHSRTIACVCCVYGSPRVRALVKSECLRKNKVIGLAPS